MSNNIILINLIHESEVNTISSYLPYLTCDICHNKILEPKYCHLCRKSFCIKCLCLHKPKVSRHIEELTDKLACKCKYNCGIEPFPLKTIYEHVDKCKFKEKYLHQDEDSISMVCNISNSYSKTSINKKDTVFKPTELNLSKQLQESNFQSLIAGKNSNPRIQCFKCNNICLTKAEYIKHAIECFTKKGDEKENMQQIFNEEFDIVRNKMSIILKEKLLTMRNIFLKELYWLIKEITDKEEEWLNKESKINKYNETKDDSLFIIDNSIKSLQEIECNLKSEKDKLIEDYDNKANKLKQLLESSNNTLFISNQSLINAYLNKATESSWIKEIVTILSLGIEGVCSKCGSDDSDNQICLICKQKYCKGKCVFKCSNANCNNYPCPKCTIECSLCHKKIYCDNCKKKCFYEKCSNLFCLSCYKKNEHQARSSTNNCKFFSCDKEKVYSCLMTTLYCVQCEKRLCNDCLVQDTNHYDSIKIFN